MANEQYTCFNCDNDLDQVNIYTTVKTHGLLDGNRIIEELAVTDPTDNDISYETVECPICKEDLTEDITR